MELFDVLTVGGAAAVVMILLQVLKAALPSMDTARWGPLLAVGLGIVVVVAANVLTVADLQLPVGQAILTGLIGGATAAGLYDATRSTVSAVGAAVRGGA